MNTERKWILVKTKEIKGEDITEHNALQILKGSGWADKDIERVILQGTFAIRTFDGVVVFNPRT